MKRQDEEYCKEQFNDFLRNTYNEGAIDWKEVDQKDEPPDYFLQILEHRYAVEVRNLMGNINVAPKPRSVAEISASLTQLVERAETIVIQQNMLFGAYAVTLTPLNNFGRVRQRLIEQIVGFVKDTSREESMPETVILETSFGRCSIEKLHNRSNYIGEVILLDPKWEIEARKELFELLQKVLNEKAHKLRLIPDDKILLVLDAFYYVDSDIWQEAIIGSNTAASFHTICRIAMNGGVQILFSKNINLLSN